MKKQSNSDRRKIISKIEVLIALSQNLAAWTDIIFYTVIEIVVMNKKIKELRFTRYRFKSYKFF
jgi:hypothetical protein